MIYLKNKHNLQVIFNLNFLSLATFYTVAEFTLRKYGLGKTAMATLQWQHCHGNTAIQPTVITAAVFRPYTSHRFETALQISKFKIKQKKCVGKYR